ncbi:hypothetical protein EJB05_54931, partial [Eragrostis curvula]
MAAIESQAAERLDLFEAASTTRVAALESAASAFDTLLLTLFRPNQPNAAAAAAEATVVAAPGVTGSAELGASFPYYHYPVEDGLGFKMQGYFDMEQAMLIDPPQPSAAWIEDDYGCDVSLWSY